MSRAEKGTAFEREIATSLSLWWTGGERSDVFWRVGGSGGRARVRGRKGKETKNQNGDIFATDPIGQPLIDLLCIECKKGYNRHSVQDILDNNGTKEQVYSEWIRKAIEMREQSGAAFWMIIVKRDRRKPIVIVPISFMCLGLTPEIEMSLSYEGRIVCAILLSDFFKFDPKKLEEIINGCRNS